MISSKLIWNTFVYFCRTNHCQLKALILDLSIKYCPSTSSIADSSASGSLQCLVFGPVSLRSCSRISAVWVGVGMDSVLFFLISSLSPFQHIRAGKPCFMSLVTSTFLPRWLKTTKCLHRLCLETLLKAVLRSFRSVMFLLQISKLTVFTLWTVMSAVKSHDFSFAELHQWHYSLSISFS